MEDKDFSCEECGRSFDSKRGLSIHKSQMHAGDKSDEKTGIEEESSNEYFDLRIPKPSFNNGKLIAAALIVGLVVGFAGGQISPSLNSFFESPAPSNTGSSTVDVSKIDLEGEPTLGSQDAEVTIVEYTDYQCPFCRRHATATFPQIKENYIDTGKVKYVVKDYPVPQLGHDKAVEMAKAANCAGEQDMYWEAHSKLFEEQNSIAPRSTAKFESSELTAWMSEIGLDMERYSTCMESGISEINGDKQEAGSFETMINGRRFVSGTPSFVIWSDGDETGEPVVGAQPYSIFKSRIESELQS